MRTFQASKFDIGRIEKCARMCCEEHGHEVTGGPLDWEHYRDCLIDLLSRGTAAMFLVENEDGEIVGGIAGAIYPALLTGLLRASQIFLYVQPAYRGKISLRKLVTDFEVWAVEKGCHDVLMPQLLSMPIKTKDFYEHNGYNLMQTEYRKSLKHKEELCPSTS